MQSAIHPLPSLLGKVSLNTDQFREAAVELPTGDLAMLRVRRTQAIISIHKLAVFENHLSVPSVISQNEL